MIDEGLSSGRIPTLAELGGHDELVTLAVRERAQELAEALLSDAVRRRGVEITNAGLEGEFEKVDGIAFGRDLRGSMAPGFAEADDPQT
jgi:hypothetical protein